jgi:hypothetical protein
MVQILTVDVVYAYMLLPGLENVFKVALQGSQQEFRGLEYSHTVVAFDDGGWLASSPQ